MIVVLVDKFNAKVSTDGGVRLFTALLGLRSGDKIVAGLSDLHPVARALYGRIAMRAKRRHPFAGAFMLAMYGFGRRLIRRRVLRLIGGRPVTGIWALSNSVGPIIGSDLAATFQCPLHVSVFDIPYTFAIHPLEARYLERAMRGWVSRVSSMDFATPSMRASVRQTDAPLATDTVIWSSAGFDRSLYQPRTAAERISTIAFCGSMRFTREFDAFGRALDIINRGRAQPIRAVVYGPRPSRAQWFDYRGFIDEQSNLSAAIRSADCAYSPLPFDDGSRLLAETSFPGKIATYMASGLPVVAHAPQYASNSRFVRDNRVGIAIPSLDPSQIARCLLEFEEARSMRQEQAANCERALADHFDRASRARYFSGILGSV